MARSAGWGGGSTSRRRYITVQTMRQNGTEGFFFLFVFLGVGTIGKGGHKGENSGNQSRYTQSGEKGYMSKQG
jgi:hypothetical protein